MPRFFCKSYEHAQIQRCLSIIEDNFIADDPETGYAGFCDGVESVSLRELASPRFERAIWLTTQPIPPIEAMNEWEQAAFAVASQIIQLNINNLKGGHRATTRNR